MECDNADMGFYKLELFFLKNYHIEIWDILQRPADKKGNFNWAYCNSPEEVITQLYTLLNYEKEEILELTLEEIADRYNISVDKLRIKK